MRVAARSKIPKNQFQFHRTRGLAHGGDADAQALLGKYLVAGSRSKEGKLRAIYWLERAAESDVQEALVTLGWCCENAFAMPYNYRRSATLYKRAALLGHKVAQTNYGLALLKGQGIKKSHREGIKWITRAAKGGDAEAREILGSAYMEGKVVKADYKQGIKWLRMAARQGHADAQAALAVCLQEGKGSKPNPGGAVKWFKKAARQDHWFSWLQVGLAYLTGAGSKQDLDKAFACFNHLVRQDYSPAFFYMGKCLEQGWGVEQDEAGAAEIWRQGSKVGDQTSAAALKEAGKH